MPAERRHHCNYCVKSFKKSGDLKRHEAIHTNTRNYKCDECSKTFIQKSGLTVHLRTHTGEKPHSCDICERAFSDASSLNRHKKTHFKSGCARGATLSKSRGKKPVVDEIEESDLHDEVYIVEPTVKSTRRQPITPSQSASSRPHSEEEASETIVIKRDNFVPSVAPYKVQTPHLTYGGSPNMNSQRLVYLPHPSYGSQGIPYAGMAQSYSTDNGVKRSNEIPAPITTKNIINSNSNDSILSPTRFLNVSPAASPSTQEASAIIKLQPVEPTLESHRMYHRHPLPAPVQIQRIQRDGYLMSARQPSLDQQQCYVDRNDSYSPKTGSSYMAQDITLKESVASPLQSYVLFQDSFVTSPRTQFYTSSPRRESYTASPRRASFPGLIQDSLMGDVSPRGQAYYAESPRRESYNGSQDVFVKPMLAQLRY
ncbi:hypothetical protein SmJEL517_g02096 [Synchytrium microbalum]|uniref:C2H2-type domain-containing protein n=1 Tax=Synchytrium microbalum TaxID=1806994 RepID=A0A507CD68_9FUNG|nr:uncharacterized protein SmJEL517_g02096 [Synchytrium microbalum]TPX35483.1 hypothetical protein SmJEL517_g02096 [Synchytrium microbalum]